MDPGRRRHYGDFYDGPPGDGPVTVVYGNCQAEALRVLLATSADHGRPSVRLPAVHELTGDDIAPLRRVLARTAVLVAQPVRDDYHELPLGTAQVAAELPAGARVVRWPVVRYSGLHPYSAIVRHPDDMAAAPPVAPYHDLRTLAVAAGRRVTRPLGAERLATAFRTIRDESVAELARREAELDVAVSDVLVAAGAEAVHTLNHPGNAVLLAVAHRVQAALGLAADAVDPGRTLLGGVRAPLEEPVLTALGSTAAPRAHWVIDGAAVPDATVRDAQLRWYADRPGWVDAGLRRHGGRMSLLGL